MKTGMKLTLVTAFVLAGYPAHAEEKATEKGAEKLHGAWNVIAAEARGEKVELAWFLTFKANGKVNLADRKAGQQSLFRWKVDTSVTPHKVELEYLGPDANLKGYRQLGIWVIESEKLKLYLNPPKVSDYPTDFKDKNHEGFLLTLEKM